MKNNIIMRMLGLNIFFGLAIIFSGQSCNDDDEGNGRFSGCGLERIAHQEVVDVEGTVTYFEGVDVYAIRFVPEPQQGANIDTVIYGIVCDLAADLKNSGTGVIFSGTFENLTENERVLFEPIPSETEIYVLDYDKIETNQ